MPWIIEEIFLGRRMSPISEADVAAGRLNGTIVPVSGTTFFRVAPTLNALTITPLTGQVNVPYVGTVIGRWDGSALAFTGAAPPGLTLNSAAGTITGTPTQANSFALGIIETLAGANGSPRTSAAGTLVVSAAVTVLGNLTLSPLAIVVNTAYNGVISGRSAGSALSGSLPAGLTLNSAAGTITGTPTAQGSTAISIVETLAGATGSPKTNAVGTLVVQPPVVVLGNLTLSPLTVTVNTAYTGTISGRSAGSALSGSLPAGLTLNSAAGTITGTPTVQASTPISIVETLASATGSPKTNAVGTLVVQPAAGVLGNLTLSPLTANQGSAYTGTISGRTATSVLTGSVPAGLTLNSAAGTITGTPTAQGSTAISIVETLAGATGNPKTNAVGTLVVGVPSLTPVNRAIPAITGPFEQNATLLLDVGTWDNAVSFEIKLDTTEGSPTNIIPWTAIIGTSFAIAPGTPIIGTNLLLSVRATGNLGITTVAVSAPFGPIIAGLQFVASWNASTIAPTANGYPWSPSLVASNTILNNAYPITSGGGFPYGWGGSTNSSMSSAGHTDPRISTRCGFSVSASNAVLRFALPVAGVGTYRCFAGFGAPTNIAAGCTVYEGPGGGVLGALLYTSPTINLTSGQVGDLKGNNFADSAVGPMSPAEWDSLGAATGGLFRGGRSVDIVTTAAAVELLVHRKPTFATQLTCFSIFKV